MSNVELFLEGQSEMIENLQYVGVFPSYILLSPKKTMLVKLSIKKHSPGPNHKHTK